MPSRSSRELSEFLDDLRTSAADNAALFAVRQHDRLDPFQYLEFLNRHLPDHPPARTLPPRHEPFTL